MRLRPLLRPDLPRVLDIAITCFENDALFLRLYPHQSRYPKDLRRVLLVRMRARLVQVGSHGYVAETEDGCACRCCAGPDPTGSSSVARKGNVVVGFGFFIREGTDAGGREKWRRDDGDVCAWPRRLERWLLGWDVWYEMNVLQRANDPAALTAYARVNGWEFQDEEGGYWVLGLLGVDPEYQRRGIGEMIVRHGLQIAEGEGVPVVLKASVVGMNLYRKLGFEVIPRKDVGDEGLEREMRMLGGVQMIWEPPKLKGRWLEADGTLKPKYRLES